MTRKYDKGDQPNGGETTWTNTGATRYGRGQHKTGSFGDDMLGPSPNHGTQRLPNDEWWTAKNLRQHTNSFSDYLNGNYAAHLFLFPSCEAEILHTTTNLKASTSEGYDNVSIKLLKHTVKEVPTPLAHIVNLSLSHGIFPNDMKLAKIVPIFKNGNTKLFNNYRPISILPAFSKILEKIVCNRLLHFLESKNILYKHQYGFRKNHNTIHPVIHL